MTGARLDGANLSGASLRATTFEDSSLIRTNIRFTDLTDAVLESADLSHIDGWGVKLDRAGARLDFAELEEASLTGISALGPASAAPRSSTAHWLVRGCPTPTCVGRFSNA